MRTDTAADELTSDVPLDPAGRIARDISCLHCGYNLRGLLPEQVCPECGAAVQPSLRGDRLQFSDPRWLKRLSTGMTCILAGQVVVLAIMYGAIRWLDFWLADVWGLAGPAARVAEILLAFGLQFTGVWLATSPEPQRIPSARDSRTRLAAMILLAAFLLFMLTAALSPVGTAARPATMADMRWSRLRDLISWLLHTAAWIALCIHISSLAHRAGAHRLARFTLAPAVGLATMGLISAGISAWFSTHVQQWLTRTPSATATALNKIDWVVETLREAFVLLMAFVYRRFLRRQTRLAQGERQAASAVAAP